MFMRLGLFRSISLMVMVIVAGATYFATSVHSRGGEHPSFRLDN